MGCSWGMALRVCLALACAVGGAANVCTAVDSDLPSSDLEEKCLACLGNTDTSIPFTRRQCKICKNGSCDTNCWYSGEKATHSSQCGRFRGVPVPSSLQNAAAAGTGVALSSSFAIVVVLVVGFAVHRRRSAARLHTTLATSDSAELEHDEDGEELQLTAGTV